MREKTLIYICFIGFFTGIFLLMFISDNLQIDKIDIGEIGKEHIGDIVNVSGEIVDSRHSQGHLFFTLTDRSGNIRVVLWNDTLKYLELQNVDTAAITDGKELNMLASVELYKGELELIPLREYIS
jgi:DNA/RNA endonuclease YhcR with UshA esterase domain